MKILKIILCVTLPPLLNASDEHGVVFVAQPRKHDEIVTSMKQCIITNNDYGFGILSTRYLVNLEYSQLDKLIKTADTHTDTLKTLQKINNLGIWNEFESVVKNVWCAAKNRRRHGIKNCGYDYHGYEYIKEEQEKIGKATNEQTAAKLKVFALVQEISLATARRDILKGMKAVNINIEKITPQVVEKYLHEALQKNVTMKNLVESEYHKYSIISFYNGRYCSYYIEKNK